MTIVWTDYMRYRAALRGFDLTNLESIIRHSSERYIDTATGRLVVVGRHDRRLVMIPYEVRDDHIVPVTGTRDHPAAGQVPDSDTEVHP